MNRFGTSSRPASATGSDLSSPALPELSLDASLQRLHQQEDNSASSLSSAAQSRAWLQSSRHASLESGPPSPVRSISTGSQISLDRNQAFRFPPLEQAQPSTTCIATGVVGQDDTPVEEPALPSRPRTSRGLKHSKPFLSSSRATSIASLVQVDVEPTDQQTDSQIRFGTPFAGNAFQTTPGQAEHPSSPTRPIPAPSSSSISASMRGFSAPSPTQPYMHVAAESKRVEALRLHASPQSAAPSLPSSWTVLFVPLEQTHPTDAVQDALQSSLLLPLLTSFHDQVEQLRIHLFKDLPYQRDFVGGNQVELFLDLSSISTLPSNTLPRLTSQSWSITFNRFLETGAAKDDGPVPHLFRETGLPIAALIRYNFTSTSSSLVQFQRKHSRRESSSSRAQTSSQPLSAALEPNTYDNGPWARRESQVTLSPSNFSRPAPSLTMTSSRSYPGIPRTPARRNPMPYSPSRTTFRSDALRPQISAHPSFLSGTSPMSHSISEGSKLRSLSLAAVHPLSPARGAETSVRSGETVHHSHKQPSELDSSKDIASSQQPDTHLSSLPGIRANPRSSHGSSHYSHPSNSTTLSSRSTRDTSIHSSIHTQISSNQDGSDNDEESDPDLGSRFWTQLSNLGEQVFRESKQGADMARQHRRSGERSVSISSTASDASVFDFSPLGILVPTDTPLDSNIRDGDKPPAESVSYPHDEPSASSSSLSPALATQTTSILGRRRAYSSMVPLSGWRAGDSDLRTSEGHQAASDLPQVLLLEPRGGVFGHDHSDLITPTVASFQGRARALSVQPSGTSSLVPASARIVAPRLQPVNDRQNVWDEAMFQLTERLLRSNLQSSRDRNSPPDVVASPQGTPSEVEPIDVLGSGARPSSSRSSAPRRLGADAWSDDTHSSPLPGLFYDSWVERVDGGIVGELGRRGSTSESKAPTSAVDSIAEAAANSSGLDVGILSATTYGSDSSSGSTLHGSEGSGPLLQDLQETDWPHPQPRSEPPRSESRPLLSASFLSVASPLVDDEVSRTANIHGSLSKSNAGEHSNMSSAKVLASTTPPETALAPVWLTRSQTTWVPQPSQPPIENDRSGQTAAMLTAPGGMLTDWADLAQRLHSPGSMRLLCLAAASWPLEELDASAHGEHSDAADSTAVLPTGLPVPFDALQAFAPRSRSYSAVEPSTTSLQEEAIEPRSSQDAATNETAKDAVDEVDTRGETSQRRGLSRAKAALLEPIRIPPNSGFGEEAASSGGSVHSISHLPGKKIMGGRMKRSMSNIFDLPSPIDARPS